jgi:predicted NBD/HSP70 family sugar kinase
MNTIIGIDIGGTSISASVYATLPTTSNLPLKTVEAPLKRGLPNILATLEMVVKTLSQSTPTLLPIIGVGTAGQISDNHIVPNTAYNLESYPKEFDNINFAKHIQSILPNSWRVHVTNDAITQGIGILLNTPPKDGFYRYIGIGTGLGAATFQRRHPKITPLTDNDLATLPLPSIGHDTYFKPHFNTSKIPAESILSGPGFKRATGYAPKEVAQNATLLQQYQPCITIMGEYLGELMSIISKKESQHTVLFGGSMATEPPFSEILAKGMTTYFDTHNLLLPTQIYAKHSKNCGTLGAAYLAYETYN